MRFVIFSLLLSSLFVSADDLHKLFEAERQWRHREYPISATAEGVHDYDDRLSSNTPADLKRRTEALRAFRKQAEAVDPATLSTRDAVSRAIFIELLSDEIRDYALGGFRLGLTAESGFHSSLASLPRYTRFKTAKDYENYLRRLAQFPRYFAEQTAFLQQGVDTGWTLPKGSLTRIAGTISAHVIDDPRQSTFYAPFLEKADGVETVVWEKLQAKAEKVVRNAVIPAYRDFHAFMVNTYIPAARDDLGASQLPKDGAAYYRHVIKRYTTLDLDPEDVHQTGLAEVKRIRAEMQKVIEAVGFEGDFAAFLKFLRTDPRFYAKTPEELLQRASWICKRMDGALPRLFTRLPRQPYTVEPVPDYLAPGYTGGRYVPASIESTQPGTYWLNTYDLKSRPLYILEALSLHEAVPGHHLQSALSQELGDLPAFRRNLYLSAFGEGWALYSEYLGLEVGFYQDPYSNFGRLTYEMWRACRLVVDTGIHAKGWTRQQAIDYLASNTALSIHECTTETDRYITWPAQALSYKIGELKIRALRTQAEQTLGKRFDKRKFHDAILANGSVPLPILEQAIQRFIKEEAAKG
ncbi:DUF885 domain-containing protein [Acanthopleuribacter pedis]|uniref:DUF885 domain-containing protein n=1 Tax=Acanthopleuribacter pedis TaxID=442870 RepID=A0A8J7PZ85_9BACT|nr:DUF885 domain-containing protein [Acanthopleuribacter pedis]MBO1317422.1 DUF885 domain-containing protein [Acanthopleuribacter pedis]